MEIEFRVIDDEELPPVIIKKGENDSPKIIINNYQHTKAFKNKKALYRLNQQSTKSFSNIFQLLI